MQNVGGERDDLRAAGRQAADRLAHGRMVECDNANAARLPSSPCRVARQRFWVEAFDRMDAHVEFRARRALRAQLFVQHADESVGADRQNEVEPDRLGNAIRPRL